MTAEHYSCDFNTTPSRKRKRQLEHFEDQNDNPAQSTKATVSCFTNAAFCSTPKKIVAKRRSELNRCKENIKISAELIKPTTETNKHDTSETQQNPFEVIRKPPKKKKRHSEELACFENHALNLDVPEKLFNPYEIVRKVTDNKNPNCFSNPALNLKVNDASVLCNPFEVQRQASYTKSLNSELKTVSRDPFAIAPELKEDLTPKPCQIKLGLPFAPKLGCRIDFKDISISQLTPSKLFAEKLVFSPVEKTKISLYSIGEESPMDIGNELDRYQLELENGINEARLQKNRSNVENLSFLHPDSDCGNKPHYKQKSKFVQKLYGIPENVENKLLIEEAFKQKEYNIDLNAKKEENLNTFQNNITEGILFQDTLQKQYEKTETAEVIAIENLDELYGCSSDDREDSFDFKSPAPFVRAYTRQEVTNLKVSKESLEPSKPSKSGENENDIKKLLNVKNIIRKSIRKFVHAHQNDQFEKNTKKEHEHEKQKGFMNAIRSSFRRKVPKNPESESEIKTDISIIDSSERTMKLKTDALFSEYMNVEDLTNEKNPNSRSCIRKSTRDVRNQLLKSVFHKKHEEYDFRK